MLHALGNEHPGAAYQQIIASQWEEEEAEEEEEEYRWNRTRIIACGGDGEGKEFIHEPNCWEIIAARCRVSQRRGRKLPCFALVVVVGDEK